MTNPSVSERQVPRHVAIIMDGNGRWAKRQGLLRTAGHKVGVKATKIAVTFCVKRKIEALTLFAFSSENWQRPKAEVSMLMDLFLRTLETEVEELHANNVKMAFIGDLSAFNEKLRKRMLAVADLTQNNTGLNLNIAVNYGGRWDIVNAVKHLSEDLLSGSIEIQDIDEASLQRYMSLPDLPCPDLFIRTGGDQRISNYLLWYLAYTELFFTDVLWPDFDEDCFQEALDVFTGRERRYGRTSEQLVGDSNA